MIERTETRTETVAECWAPKQEEVRLVLHPRPGAKRRKPLHRDLTSSEARDLARDLMEAADAAEEMDPPWEPVSAALQKASDWVAAQAPKPSPYPAVVNPPRMHS